MNSILTNRILILVAFLTCFATACALGQAKQKSESKLKKTKHKKTYLVDSNTPIPLADVDTTGCNPDIWNYVYNPDRLKLISKCITVSGVIEETNADDDGDQHMLLKLDKGQEYLLAERNKEKKSGNLVIEAVCINAITLHKVGKICDGYINHVQLPRVGNHVLVTGSFVIDSHNGWSEIHPITKIVVQ